MISNLTIVDAAGSAGLFSTLSGTVRGLGLADVDVSGVGGSSTNLAPLAAELSGTAISSWASGRVHVGSTGLTRAGGLVGRVSGANSRLAASYSTASVTGAGSSASWAGGLAAVIHNGATVVACYATGLVDEGGSGSVRAGGLIGSNVGPTTVRASYFAGTVAGSGVGGIVAADDGSNENYYDVYFDTDSTGLTGGAGQTMVDLQTPTSATGTLYANWDDLDVDGDGTADEDPWDFGAIYNHPALNYGGLDPADQRNDYDADGDGLIEVATLGRLNAMRWDVDGDGGPSAGDESNYFGRDAFFNAVFLNPVGTGLCPTTEDDADDNDCAGYELTADIDFDTDGSGSVDMSDAIPNWTPIPGWATTLDGGGHVIENLTISGAGNDRGLLSWSTTAATVRSLGLVDVSVTGSDVRLGALAGVFNGRIAAVYATGSVSGAGGVGGLVAEVQSSSGRIVASYSTVDVECTANQNWARAGGLAARNDGQISASYAAGKISGNCPGGIRGGLVSNSPGTEPLSYWDTDLTGIADDTDSPPQPPEGRSSLAMQTPTAYDTVVGGEALYSAWDDQDVDGDGETGDDDDADPWDFGLSNQHPILKYGGLAASHQLAAQPQTPTFATSTRAAFQSARTFRKDYAIQAFQIPAASYGNGALTYADGGLPAGLTFDADGTGSCPGNAPRMVCGAPTATTTAPATATITVSDSDMETGAMDEDTLTFTVEVVAPSAAISSPAALAEATLNGALLRVALIDATFESGATAASFSLTTNPNLPGLSVGSLAATPSGATSTTLTLSYTGGGFDRVRTLAVTVADAAHALPGALTTGTVNIVPTASVSVNPTSLSLTEGGSGGTYGVVLGGQPLGSVTVEATSGDAAVSIDSDATPLTRTLAFTPMTWDTAQTVTATPADDDDAEDESVTISHGVSNYPGVTTAASVSVTVDDDETKGIVIDADPSTAAVVDGGPLALLEGAGTSTPYTVKLASQPTGTVTVTVTSTDAAAATADTDPATGLQNTLSFTTQNWDTAQTAWLTPVDDTDPNSEEVDIRHEANGGGYNGVLAILQAVVADDDVGVILDTDPTNLPGDQTTPIALREGETRTYLVRLSTLPVGGGVTVSATSSNAAITATPGSLSFNAGNWQTAQTVTVRAEQDDDAVGEWTLIANEANGGQYAGETTTFRATAADDEMSGTDYDADGDFLIEISSLAQLNAVRWDLDGDGEVDSSANETSYRAAFAGSAAADDMGCLDGPDAGDDGDCAGYELMANLDFDTDDDGDVDADDPNSYANWAPIGGSYAATFDGNNRTISNLTIDATEDAGLFHTLATSSAVLGLGLADVDARITPVSPDIGYLGALAYRNFGTVLGAWSSGSLVGVGGDAYVGGLVAYQEGRLAASYSSAAVTGGRVAGGLVAQAGGRLGATGGGRILASYATGAVTATTFPEIAGGLIGLVAATSTIQASYFAGALSSSTRGGLAALDSRRQPGHPELVLQQRRHGPVRFERPDQRRAADAHGGDRHLRGLGRPGRGRRRRGGRGPLGLRHGAQLSGAEVRRPGRGRPAQRLRCGRRRADRDIAAGAAGRGALGSGRRRGAGAGGHVDGGLLQRHQLVLQRPCSTPPARAWPARPPRTTPTTTTAWATNS